jgi:hypothetical protein
MKSRLATLVVVTALGSGLPLGPTSAHASPGAVPLLRIGLDLSESSLDQAKNVYANWLDSLTLDTVMEFGSLGQLELGLGLATAWAQPNPVTYVYQIRHGSSSGMAVI